MQSRTYVVRPQRILKFTNLDTGNTTTIVGISESEANRFISLISEWRLEGQRFNVELWEDGETWLAKA